MHPYYYYLSKASVKQASRLWGFGVRISVTHSSGKKIQRKQGGNEWRTFPALQRLRQTHLSSFIDLCLLVKLVIKGGRQ